ESTLSAVVVTTARNSGGTLELRAVGEDDSLGETLAGGEFAGDGEVRLEPDEPVEAERVALWLSELPSDSNEAGRLRGRVAEIEAAGALHREGDHPGGRGAGASRAPAPSSVCPVP